MDHKKTANALSESLSAFGNIRVTAHFVQRVIERKLDFKGDAMREWASLNRNDVCQLIYKTELNGCEHISQSVIIDGVKFIYIVQDKKIIWKTIYA